MKRHSKKKAYYDPVENYDTDDDHVNKYGDHVHSHDYSDNESYDNGNIWDKSHSKSVHGDGHDE